MWNYNGDNPSNEKIYKMWCKNEELATKRLQAIISEMSPSGIKRDIIRTRAEYKNYKLLQSNDIEKAILCLE